MNIQELKLNHQNNLLLKLRSLALKRKYFKKQEILFAILKKVAEKEEITSRCFTIASRWIWFLRAMESNYLPDPDFI